jgi:hypothetical protein
MHTTGGNLKIEREEFLRFGEIRKMFLPEELWPERKGLE